MSIPRPRIKKTRYWIDNEFIEQEYMAKLHASVTKVYAVLARHANARTQVCFPSLATIGEESGITSRSTIIEAIRTLEQYAIVDVIRSPHKSNHYLLRDCRTWLPVANQSDEMTRVVQSADQGSHLTATLNHKSESEKEIMDSILEKLDPSVRSLVLSDFENRRTILALKEIEKEGVHLSTLDIGKLCYYLDKKDVHPIKRHSWINYDDGFKKL
jgi:hypothetical protein